MSDVETKSFYNRIIYKKYKIKKLMYKSVFSNVYEGMNIKDNIPVVLKIEKKGKYDLLETEAYLLMHLKGFGIPEVISFGKHGNYKVLIEELLGPTIEYLWEKNAFKKDPFGTKNMFVNDICMLAIQGLDRLEFIHSKNILHRDIKTKNFIIGRKDPNIIYIIDFGFSKKYRSSRTGKHLKFAYTNTSIGSIFFSSRYAIRGYELSRRDDLESFGYMILYLAKGGNMPWTKQFDEKIDILKKVKEITKQKMEINDEKLCAGLPVEFVNYMKYVKNLDFEQEPDYKYLKGLFINILSANETRRNFQFFWIKPKIKKKKEINTNNPSDYKQKLASYKAKKKHNHSLIRLYNRVKSSLNQKYNNNTEYNLHTGNKLTIENSENLRTEMIENKAAIKKYMNLPITLNEKNLKKDIKKPFKLDVVKKTKTRKILTLKNKDFSNEKKLLRNKLLDENIHNQINLINNYNKYVLNKLKGNYIGLNKGITLYKNLNYNNLYFINNNSGINSNSLIKPNLLMKNVTHNFQTINTINNINLKRNIRYNPLFKNNKETNILKVNHFSNISDILTI
jgi:serine/threonine protein kinase